MFRLFLVVALLAWKSPIQGYFFSEQTPVLNHLTKVTENPPESGLPLIDCIYVINLDERPQKWNKIQDELGQNNLHALRFSAINGWKLREDIKQKLFGPYSLNLNGGQTGCLLSHLSIVYDAYRKGYSHIWVLEDDIKINEPPQVLEELLMRLCVIDPEWDLFFTDPDTKNSKGETILSWDVFVRPDQPAEPVNYYRERIVIDDDLMEIRQRFGMYSVIISSRGVQKIIDYFSHVYLWSPIDIDIFYIPEIKVYAARRDIVTVNWQIPISDTVSPPSNNDERDDIAENVPQGDVLALSKPPD
ncbi:glycosyltransferase family 25 protein [Estrella lausannensis]|uniref:Glycosyltransferase n=1 Tax=Estrella lausannensis TaxID=483423 RepID=A0A0H5E4U2_9BACT|nr:glycosyltransferase family 25 protein [Estrella lausannensis]CRX38270.1 Glycosyltransferase [Estrella lausannensis]